MGASAQSDSNAIEKPKPRPMIATTAIKAATIAPLPKAGAINQTTCRKTPNRIRAADQAKRAATLPEALLQQQAKRHQRANHHGGGNKPLPAIAPSQQIPRGLVRQIAVPDDNERHEIEINGAEQGRHDEAGEIRRYLLAPRPPLPQSRQRPALKGAAESQWPPRKLTRKICCRSTKSSPRRQS